MKRLKFAAACIDVTIITSPYSVLPYDYCLYVARHRKADLMESLSLRYIYASHASRESSGLCLVHNKLLMYKDNCEKDAR